MRVYYPVYDGKQQKHLTSGELFVSLARMPKGKIITDAMAQTIASWWYTGRNSYTMQLATGGVVDRYLTLEDFHSPDDPGVLEADRKALKALGAYIEHHQDNAESAYRACACHECMYTAVGTPGQVCLGCEEWGCDPTDDQNGCEIEEGCGPYCECIYCIPGA